MQLDLDQDIQSLRPGTADFVMCSNQLLKVKKKFQNVLKEFHHLELQFSQRQKDRMLREMRIVKADATQDDVEEFLESGQGGIFAQQVLHSSRYGDARNALKQVQDRQADIRNIESTVEELAQLFLDLNTLIEQQDYTIDQVYEHVEETVVHLEKGEQEVEKAIVHRKNSIKVRFDIVHSCWVIALSLLLTFCLDFVVVFFLVELDIMCYCGLYCDWYRLLLIVRSYGFMEQVVWKLIL
jgi:syntaxin 1B/2/3